MRTRHHTAVVRRRVSIESWIVGWPLSVRASHHHYRAGEGRQTRLAGTWWCECQHVGVETGIIKIKCA